jgi:transposase-like protein
LGTVSGKGSTVKRKRYSRKLQRMAVERMRTCENVDELARELGVRPRCLYKWRAKLEALEPGEEAARPSTHAAAYRKENLRLKRLLAEKTSFLRAISRDGRGALAFYREGDLLGFAFDLAPKCTQEISGMP